MNCEQCCTLQNYISIFVDCSLACLSSQTFYPYYKLTYAYFTCIYSACAAAIKLYYYFKNSARKFLSQKRGPEYSYLINSAIRLWNTAKHTSHIAMVCYTIYVCRCLSHQNRRHTHLRV